MPDRKSHAAAYSFVRAEHVVEAGENVFEVQPGHVVVGAADGALHNQYFIRWTRERTQEGSASLRVLSHDIGNHLLHHTLMLGPGRTLDATWRRTRHSES